MNEKEVRIDLKKAAGLIAAGIVLNLVCARVASWLGLPLYFDCIGTVLAAVVGGYMPAITIGFFSNVFNGLLGSQNTLYYAVISVLVAVAAAYLDQNDYFENPGKTFFAGLVLAAGNGTARNLYLEIIERQRDILPPQAQDFAHRDAAAQDEEDA